MKQILITEKAPTFVVALRSELIGRLGAKETSNPFVLEVPDDFDPEHWHGIVFHNPSEKTFEEANPEVCAWLENYKGDFEFYLSLKSQLASRGTLSPKQVDSIHRAIAREATPKAPKEIALAPKQFSIEVGEVIGLTKRFAREVAEKSGLVRPHYSFIVTAVHSETEKAFQLTLRLTAQKTGRCACCGMRLTDPQSVIIGIGPDCADKNGIDHGSRAIEELEVILAKTVEVKTWLPKAVIKRSEVK